MNNKKSINVLSLFDGISVAQLSLKQLNIPIKNYYASEIDKNAIKVTQHHFPNTIQLGDIRDIDINQLPEIDLIIFGSPCQDLSSMRKNRKGLAGNKSSLFYYALKILKAVKPKYFLMENVASMPKADQKIISDLLGVEPLKINSNLFSMQNRNRLYWTNIKNITIPTDKEISEIIFLIEPHHLDRWDKSNAVLTKNVSHTVKGLKRYLTKSIGQVAFFSETVANADKDELLEFIEHMSTEQVRKIFRLFTMPELERLQTLPVGYVSNILKKTPAHHAIGNAFTLEVIKHLLSFADFNTTNDYE